MKTTKPDLELKKIICPVAKVNFRRFFFCSTLFTYLLLTNFSANAQESRQGEFPPPLKLLSKEEKSLLEAQNDLKKRTVLALELMEARFIKAEGFSSREEFREMFTELGGFHALMDNTLAFLYQNNSGSGKVLNNFKRIEINLRKYITRLEVIRRDLPLGYEPYVRRLTVFIREARTKAVEPMFDKTILSGNDSEQ